MLDAYDAGWMQTFTGKRFYPLKPRVEDICIDDIAHALSLQNCFTGHTREPYSVAQHSVLVSHECLPEDALWGLLHDASEAYLSDISRPVKCQPLMEPYREAERRLMACICIRFNLPLDEPVSVKGADEILLTTEARDLMGPLLPGWRHTPENGYKALSDRIVPWDWREAEFIFLERFRFLDELRVGKDGS